MVTVGFSLGNRADECVSGLEPTLRNSFGFKLFTILIYFPNTKRGGEVLQHKARLTSFGATTTDHRPEPSTSTSSAPELHSSSHSRRHNLARLQQGRSKGRI
ncbi:uncharacterized protein HMPREF1120_04652 [Exophiala dermatitidis NIH/UT8656]|uniref:Uncharacterized protein n=1 Tax=Exophiala dermatitidis (strain ATCC 34100 / CBS 525.76 / NIH/UT8656) TaxID=858893 RepID=H6BXQ0_EXODN|nr:uncharacterized protein HMPREF1120_04652 [Exophiala dermatitidis NIH/UT8656]EHY56576.1 hypothetical protein HMPREF1120_04652 [Exophiala dermatitidis NIH/UT8656]